MWELTGITSWGPSCGGSTPTPSVFSSVPSYRVFLESPAVPWLPALVAPPLATGTARVGGTLRCTVRWRVTPRVSRTAWLIAPRAQLRPLAATGDTNLPGARAVRGATLRPTEADRGKMAVCVVVANGAPGVSMASITTPRPIAGAARRVTTLPVAVVG